MALSSCAGACRSQRWAFQHRPSNFSLVQTSGSINSRSALRSVQSISSPLHTLLFTSPLSVTFHPNRMNSLDASLLSPTYHGFLHSNIKKSPRQLIVARAAWLPKHSSLKYLSTPSNWAHRSSNFRAGERKKLVAVTRASISTTSTSLGAQEDGSVSSQPVVDFQQQAKNSPLLAGWKPPRYVWRSVACLIIAGQVIMRVIKGKIHVRNSVQQLSSVGPGSLGVSLLTASFVGMVFTIQFVREFARLGLTRSVGGVLALALARELSPVVTAIILAGRVGSAFAAELGTMQVSEQTDTLRVLRTDPIDYLITPRVLACCISLPILTIICFSVGMAASVLLADSVYHVSSNIILESAARALQPWDLISTSIKSVVFGGIISIVSCAWGVTTAGGAKGVGESTTSAVVISLVCIFIADFILSWCFFQGAGDALKAAMG
ncbi:hypothetical protein Mapa_012262 [Marchantia paleacea]|nr:hypothetical protein Mapa_012262 [Marchantia paleacea]